MATLIAGAAREAFVRRVRLEMVKQGLTRDALAERADVKERTLGNLLAGHPVRDATVARIARVLGVDLDQVLGAAPETAEGGSDTARAGEAYGGYMLAMYQDYVGTYVAWRRAFSGGPELYRSIYEIDWDEGLSRLRFLELHRTQAQGRQTTSPAHAGGIHISPHTGLLQLLTTYQGALRLVTLTRFRQGDHRLRGLILTQSDRAMFYQPAVSPIFLEKLDHKARLSDLERLVGAVGSSDGGYAAARAELEDVARSSVFMAG